MKNLTETLADVAALIPRYSWEIMDEEQRDDLMAKIVLPRYMQTTADGVKLGPTAWSQMVGASAKAIETRVYRLKQSQNVDSENPSRSPEWRKTDDRKIRQAARERPEIIIEAITKAPPSSRGQIMESIARDPVLGTESGAALARVSQEHVASGRRLVRDIDPDTASIGHGAQIHVQFQHARERLKKAMELLLEAEPSDSLREDLQRISREVFMLADWLRSYVDSGNRSFDTELEELLKDGAE